MPKSLEANKTGLPLGLKLSLETLSGYSMDDVQVHYNSDKPAQLQAHAYAQGTNIYIAPGQEKHLPHEAWHVVQQKQSRVKPTSQIKAGVWGNDYWALEKEADIMGTIASLLSTSQAGGKTSKRLIKIDRTDLKQVVQRVPVGGAGLHDPLRNVEYGEGYPTFTWTNGKKYHMNFSHHCDTKHVTLLEYQKVHYFFDSKPVGHGWELKSKHPQKNERGVNNAKDTKKTFDKLDEDLRDWIERNYQALLNVKEEKKLPYS